MADVFNEVDEHLRSARSRELVVRAWPYVAAVVAAVILATLGVWAWSAYAASEQAKASTSYAAGLAALQKGRTAEASRAFAETAQSAPPGYRALALMQQAGIRLKAGKTQEAVELFDQASHAAPDRVVGDVASLKAVYALLDTADFAELKHRLDPLIATGRPYREMAREALAVAELKAGRTAEAKSDFSVLMLAQDVSDATRARARAALAMIQSGTAGELPAVVKAELALPPQPPTPPAAVPGQPSGAQ